MIKTFLGGILLPVNPLEEIHFTSQSAHSSQHVLGIGEVVTPNKKNLLRIVIQSLFSQRGPYSSSASPRELVNKLLNLQDSATRFIVEGEGINWNLEVVIDSFDFRMPFGEAGDYYYTLTMREYKKTTAKERATTTTTTTAVTTPVKQTPKTYVIKSGDSLWKIAKSVLGDGGRWKEIYDLNRDKIKNPDVISIGKELRLP